MEARSLSPLIEGERITLRKHKIELAQTMFDYIEKDRKRLREFRCSDLNERSSRIPINCGYTLDGTLRNDKIEHGQYRSTQIFGKLKSE